MLFRKTRAFARKLVTELSFVPYFFTDFFYKSPIPLPPVRLRYRIGNDLDPQKFINKGRILSQNILDGIKGAGYDPAQFRSVLDFGCGCGRVIGFLRQLLPDAAWYGADIDAELISWMRSNYPKVEVVQNPFHPPSTFQDGQFDLIYGISVFTHLNELFQDEWLTELNRITRPGALLLLSIHGETCYPPDVEMLKKNGFVYQVMKTGFYKLDGLPDFYQSAWHTQSYIKSHWSRWFKVVDIIKKGINNHQDIVILQRE
jgi:SAM-dependent methyltransferase